MNKLRIGIIAATVNILKTLIVNGRITMRCPKCKRKVMEVEGYTVCLNMKCEELIIEEDADESQTS